MNKNISIILQRFLLILICISSAACKKRSNTAAGKSLSENPTAKNTILIFGSDAEDIEAAIEADIKNFEQAFTPFKASENFKIVKHLKLKSAAELTKYTRDAAKDMDSQSTMIWIYVGHGEDGFLTIGPQRERIAITTLFQALPKQAIARWFGILNSCYSTQVFPHDNELKDLPAREILLLAGSPADQTLPGTAGGLAPFSRAMHDTLTSQTSKTITVGETLFQVIQKTAAYYAPMASPFDPDLYPHVFAYPENSFLDAYLLAPGRSTRPLETAPAIPAMQVQQTGKANLWISVKNPLNNGLVPEFFRIKNAIAKDPIQRTSFRPQSIKLEECSHIKSPNPGYQCRLAYDAVQNNDAKRPELDLTLEIWITEKAKYRVRSIQEAKLLFQ